MAWPSSGIPCSGQRGKKEGGNKLPESIRISHAKARRRKGNMGMKEKKNSKGAEGAEIQKSRKKR
jgi:hypothetical protein